MNTTNRATPAHKADRPRRSRRAAALVICVLIIGMVNLAVLSAVNGGGDDARLAAARAETVRAFFAAESGAAIVSGEYNAGRTIPSGMITLAGGETVTITPTGTSAPLDAVIIGSYGNARRRLEVHLE